MTIKKSIVSGLFWVSVIVIVLVACLQKLHPGILPTEFTLGAWVLFAVISIITLRYDHV